MQRKKISSLLMKLGISPSLRGFDYIITGIQLIESDRTLIHNVTKGLYPAIAEKHKIKGKHIERCIHHAVNKAVNADDRLIAEIFGNIYSRKHGEPTNSEFLGAVAEYLREDD